MKFEYTRTYNFDGAFRGMRNPKESWARSDSTFGLLSEDDIWNCTQQWMELKVDNYWDKGYDSKVVKLQDQVTNYLYDNGIHEYTSYENEFIGALIDPNDMKLAQTLIRGGSEHRKFLRQIFVSVDITAPLYWWKEFDTYKIGTVANSTSTMHKLTSKPITLECFELADFEEIEFEGGELKSLISYLENLRQEYLKTKDKKYWKELIRWLPESWLQTRTITMNYENVLSMCQQRQGHKLSEWAKFIDWAHTLPYAADLIFINEGQGLMSFKI